MNICPNYWWLLLYGSWLKNQWHSVNPKQPWKKTTNGPMQRKHSQKGTRDFDTQTLAWCHIVLKNTLNVHLPRYARELFRHGNVSADYVSHEPSSTRANVFSSIATDAWVTKPSSTLVNTQKTFEIDKTVKRIIYVLHHSHWASP